MQKWFREERFLSRVRLHLAVLASIYVATQVGIGLLAWSFDVRVVDLPNYDIAWLVFLAFYLPCVVSGRVLGWHPANNADYRKWLKSTPWEASKELPMSDVMIRWSDVCVMLVAMLTSFFFGLGIPWVIPILVFTAHLLVMVGVFWVCLLYTSDAADE